MKMNVKNAMKAGLYRVGDSHSNACPECLVMDGPQHQEFHVHAIADCISVAIAEYRTRNVCAVDNDVLDALRLVSDRMINQQREAPRLDTGSKSNDRLGNKE